MRRSSWGGWFLEFWRRSVMQLWNYEGVGYRWRAFGAKISSNFEVRSGKGFN